MRYTIKEGNNYSDHSFPKIYLGKEIHNLVANFSESCRYELTPIKEQGDVNKLWGIGFGPYPGSHMVNSIRIGWNYDPLIGKIRIYQYIHEKSKVSFGELFDINIGEDLYLTVKFDFKANSYTITRHNVIEGTKVSYVGSFKYPAIRIGYHCYPYFGGNMPAPHEMFIDLEMDAVIFNYILNENNHASFNQRYAYTTDKEKIKEILLEIFTTKYGNLLVSAFLFALFMCFAPPGGILYNTALGGKWALYAALVPGLYLIGITLVMFYYGIVNTFASIKNWFKKKSNK